MLKNKSYIGIDVGTSSVKIVEFRKSGKVIEVLRAGQAAISRESAVNLQKDFSPLALVIRQLLIDLGIGKSTGIVALPNQFAFSRFIKLPPVMTSKIGQIIEYEAQQQVPFPIDSVVWDYEVLPQQALALETEVVLCAIEKRILSGFLAAVGNLVSIEAIDVGSLALYNFVDYCQDGPGIVYIDIGAATTTLLIYEGKKFWARNLPLAGNEITETIKNELKIGFREAEKIKIQQGLTAEESGVPGKVNRAITTTLQRLIAEIQRSIGYYRSQSKDVLIEKIVVLGGGASLTGLIPFVEKNVGIKSEKINLTQHIKVSPKGTVKGDADFNASYGIACGLALRAVGKVTLTTNLMPVDVVQVQNINKRRGYFYATAAMFCLTFLAIAIGLSLRRAQLESKTQLLQGVVEECDACDKASKDMVSQIAPIKSRMEDVDRLLKSKHVWLAVLSHVTKIIPKNFWISEFIPVTEKRAVSQELDRRSDSDRRRDIEAAKNQEGFSGQDFHNFYTKVELRGKTSGDFTDVNSFRNQLSEDTFFANVEVLSAIMNQSEGVIDFIIYVEIAGETYET